MAFSPQNATLGALPQTSVHVGLEPAPRAHHPARAAAIGAHRQLCLKRYPNSMIYFTVFDFSSASSSLGDASLQRICRAHQAGDVTDTAVSGNEQKYINKIKYL
jgi:hypothetical protein